MEYQRTPTGSLIHVVPFISEDGTPLSRFFFVAQEVRRERTGVHGKITLAFQKAPFKGSPMILSYDTFNIGRNEERRRLAKSGHTAWAHDKNEEEVKRIFPIEHCYHLLDVFCNGLWDEVVGGIEVTSSIGHRVTAGPEMLLQPFLLRKGGSILFSAPGQGKSNTALLMGASINSGCDRFWQVRRAPVLYINLERDKEGMEGRLGRVHEVLGLDHPNPLLFIHARGRTLKDVHERAQKAIRQEGVEHIILDSISRTGTGRMNDDEVGNTVIDLLNSYPSWLAIGHAGRQDDTHILGTTMFDAGADVCIQLLSEKQGDWNLGLSLRITKANDIPWRSESWAYTFDVGGLTDVRRAQPGEFAELESRRAGPESLRDTVVRWMRDAEEGYASQIANDLGVPDKTGDIIRILQGEGFVFLRREAVRGIQQAIYRLA